MTARVALVTGATRGIGRVTAIELARRGFSVVVTGRTMKEGEGNLGSDELPEPVPGSIEKTVAEIEQTGGQALGVKLDLLDRSSIDAAFTAVAARFGRLDVLVNNAIYQGPDMMAPIAGMSMKSAEDSFAGTVINQIYVTQHAIGMMKGGGRIIFVTSLASVSAPNGVFGFLYGGGKAAFNRIPEFIDFEHRKDRILAFLVEPQFTMTDTMRARWGADADKIAPDFKPRAPEETARTIAWLALNPDAERHAGGALINAPDFFVQNGLDDRDG